MDFAFLHDSTGFFTENNAQYGIYFVTLRFK